MILLQFLTLFSYVIDGFTHAGESLSGYFFGAKKIKTLNILIKKLFLWSASIALLFSLVYLIGFEMIIKAFTSHNSIIDEAIKYKWWLVIIPLLSFSAYVWDGIYIGLTASSYLRNAMIIALVLVFIPAYYLSYHYIGNHSLWLAMSLFMLSRGLILQGFFKKIMR